MNKDKVYIFDTTHRDGAQTEGVDFSVENKNRIANIYQKLVLITLKEVGRVPTQ